MTAARRWGLALAALAVCAGSPAAASGRSLAGWQERIYAALLAQNVVSRETRLVALKFVCTLSVGKNRWSVIDAVEHVPGAQVPRGHNQIVLLDARMKLVARFDYADQAPMACIGPDLVLAGEYGIDNSPPYGNVMRFDGQANAAMARIDANSLPIPTSDRRPVFRLP